MKKIVPRQAILIPDDAKLTFSGILYDVFEWEQTLFDGSSATFEMLKRADTVVTIAVVNDKILLLEDENPHQGKRRNFPGGRVELDDPDVISAAKRETLEESGFSFNNWRLIKVTQPSNEIEWFVYIWLAWEVASQGELNLDAGERIEVKSIDFNELKNLVMTDQGVLGEDRDIFQNLSNLTELLNYPEYNGQLVDR